MAYATKNYLSARKNRKQSNLYMEFGHQQWKSSCGVVVSVLASYTSDPGFDPRECIVRFGCFFTVVATLLGLCDVCTQIVVRYVVLIYPGSCNVQSFETICSEVVVSKSKTNSIVN